MLCRKLTAFILALMCAATIASESRADISNAAVLFLRIAPGARAAGMGEAYVALADDATATHYNPAGLGAYPLADSWIEAKIPDDLRPVRAFAALSREGGGDYRDYDIWALTPRGLARYDHRRWNLAEIFGTKTDQTVQRLVSSYFNMEDSEQLERIVSRVAEANSPWSFDQLGQFRDQVLAAVPSEFKDLDLLLQSLDSLISGYNQCLVNWEKVRKAHEVFIEGMEDSVLTTDEAFKISVELEKSRNRFIPEELLIPYNTLFSTEPQVIAAGLRDLLVGTSDGLYAFNGRCWLTLTGAEGLPSRRILSLYADGANIYVGTDSGLVKFTGAQVAPVDSADQLPAGPVTAIGARGINDVWAVINNDLYHWDGQQWSNSFAYTVAVDDTPEKVARRFSIYGTTSEQERYVAKFRELNPDLFSGEPTTALPEEETAALDEVPEAKGAEESATEPEDEAHEAEGTGPETPPGVLTPGTIVQAPFLAVLKGTPTAIHVSFNSVWLGTDHGVMIFNYSKWSLPGYRDRVIEEGQTLESLVPARSYEDFTEYLQRLAFIAEMNEIEYEPDMPLPAGRTVRLPANPAAAPVHAIGGRVNRVFVASSRGLIKHDADGWSMVDQQGLGYADVVFVRELENGLWAATDRKIVVNASGRPQFAVMYAKWLPELADDLYYAFLSGTGDAGSWGTFGGNITFISYGTFARTINNPEPVGSFDSFDIAFTGSYGTSLTSRLKGGISAKFIYSKLAEQGAGMEIGQGTSTGFGVDLGLLYQASPRLNLGLAVTNLGPDMAYIDATQSDPLPRNLAVGFAYRLLQSDYYHMLLSTQVNKMLVGLGDGIREELKQVTLHVGAEFLYANIFALRGGYMHDEEGKLKTPTAGVGLNLKDMLRFDFAFYFGDNDNEARKGIKPVSLSIRIP
ncbi:MAG: PorV/PorQ family protein [Candidatus Zixiibacteriota bacterium]